MQKKYIISASAVVVLAVVAAFSFKACAGANTVAARVNGEVITVDEIKKAYEANPQIMEQVPFEEFYAKAVDVFVNGKLLYQAATQAKVEDTESYKDQLKSASEDIARKVYLEQIVEGKVNDAAIKDFYENQYLKNFESKKEVKAKHILVDDEATAKEVIQKLDKGGDFDKLAKEYSKDQADLGYFTEDIMVPEFSKAAFAMEKGTYSKEPVKTQFGWHVILVEDARNAEPLPQKDIEPQIRNLLTQQAIAETFDGLSGNAQIEKFDIRGKKMPNKPAEEK